MILIPAAGDGVRFKEAGYEGPKHLLLLGDIPMIERVAENVRPLDPDGQVFVVTKPLVGKTKGAVDTICRASYNVPIDQPLVVANCDQLLKLPDVDLTRATIFTFQSSNPAHSYVVSDASGKISDIVEKQAISTNAVSGVYYFPKAGPFLGACQWVLGNHGPGELYVSSALKKMILDGQDLYAVDAPTAILGTPEDFSRFEVALSLAA